MSRRHGEAEPAAAFVRVHDMRASRRQEIRHAQPATAATEVIAAADEVQSASGFEYFERHAQPKGQRLDELPAIAGLFGAAHDAGSPTREAIGALPDHTAALADEHPHRRRYVITGMWGDR